MEDNLEQTNSGAPDAASPEPQIDQSVSNTNTNTPAPDAAAPFHEHPRFKELVEQKNQFANQVKEYERRMQEMESRFSKLSTPAKEQDALLERLKGIDPEFGGRFEQIVSKLSKMEQLEQELQATKAESLQSRALSTIEQLHKENNVPKELQDWYQEKIELAAIRNPKMGLQDLPEVYKTVHSQMSQFLDGVKRSERASYVDGKKKDNSIPSTQTAGKPAKPDNKIEWSRDEATRQKQMVDLYRQIVSSQREDS